MIPPLPALPGPVVVGALGGSGTRLVADILAELGWFLGRDLNPERDNLWFTLLFKRRRWLEREVPDDPSQIRLGLDLLEKVMVTGQPLTAQERRFLGRAAAEVAVHGHDHRGSGRGTWSVTRARRMLRARPLDVQRYRGWGWKEPNSHLFLPQLVRHFPRLRFVYVLRHGLDMAYSSNDTQLQLWGSRYGIAPPPSGDLHAQAMLEFWSRVSARVIDQGRQLLGPRFLVLAYDRLVERPGEALDELLEFLEVDAAAVDLARLRRLPVRPPSLGRYRRHGLDAFPPRLLEQVRSLGFAVEA